jgi:putative acetyltransferase
MIRAVEPTISAVRLDDPAVVALTTASLAEIDAHYAGQPGSGAPPRVDEFLPPDGVFVLARLGDEPAGCGGVCRLDADTAEIRRMYVVPDARGRGVGRAILDRLLEAAGELGYRRVRLETGNRQVEAMRLYERAGFRRGDCWGPYVDDPRSRCYELELER